MKVTKNIKLFLIDRARYRLDDNGGNSLLMTIDYQNQVVQMRVAHQGETGLKRLRKEVVVIARDLLKRKSNVNFAKRT